MRSLSEDETEIIGFIDLQSVQFYPCLPKESWRFFFKLKDGKSISAASLYFSRLCFLGSKSHANEDKLLNILGD